MSAAFDRLVVDSSIVVKWFVEVHGSNASPRQARVCRGWARVRVC